MNRIVLAARQQTEHVYTLFLFTSQNWCCFVVRGLLPVSILFHI